MKIKENIKQIWLVKIKKYKQIHFLRNGKNILAAVFIFSLFLGGISCARAEIYFADDFDVSAITYLNSRTPNIGTGWTRLIYHSKNLQVHPANDHVTPESNGTNVGSFYQAEGTYSSADYEVFSVITFSPGNGDYTRSLAARVQSSNTMYLLRFGWGTFEIYKAVNGSWTRLGNTYVYASGRTASSPYWGDIVSLRVEGNQISGKVNGVTQLSVTDSDITDAGKAGLGIGYVNVSSDDSGTGVGVDNFRVATLDSTYALMYQDDSHGSISGTPYQIVTPNSDGTAITAVADSGYSFVNWSDGSTDNPRTDTNVMSDVSVVANFETIPSYTLSYSAGANGSISGSTSQTITEGGDGSAVTAVPNSGYHFVNWSDSSTDNPRTDTNVTGNISVTANFAANSFSLSYAAGTGGSLTGDVSQTVNYGENGSAITAVPDLGYAFDDWSDGSTENPRTDTNVTGNISVTANFRDSQAPAISEISASPSDDGAEISWTTSENSSSRVEYGLTSGYGNNTTETDTSTRVIAHNVSLNNLQACTRYHYQVKSKDASDNEEVSDDETFATTGCEVSEISDGNEDEIATSGGSVSLNTDDGSAELEAPDGYYSQALTVQLNK